MKTTIRIYTATGRTITRRAEITDYTNGVSVAVIGATRYTICKRDAGGPIWRRDKFAVIKGVKA